MSIVSGEPGDLLVLRTFKHLTTRVDTTWVNNYEFVAVNSWDSSQLIQCATAVQVYEQAFHSEVVQFDRWTFSTWEPDSTPYDPESFMGGAWPAGTTGLVGLSTLVDVEPVDITLWVQRQVMTGRQGKLFYRGVLGEPFVTAPGGVPVLSGTTIQDKFDDAYPNIGPYIDGYDEFGSPEPFRLALIGKTGQTRLVKQLVLKGVAINKRDRGYFDRV